MPVEIKELVIRAVVQDDGLPGGTKAGSQTAVRGSRPFSEDERAALIEEAVREVLRVIKAGKER